MPTLFRKVRCSDRGGFGNNAAVPAGPRVLIAVVAALLLVPLAGAGGVADAAKAKGLPGLDARVLEEVNAVRASHGLSTVRLSGALAAAAGRHSMEMVLGGYFAHDGMGASFSRRLAAYYPAGGYRRWTVAENLVWGSPSIGARQALRLWLHSPEHRANLLRRGWREVGVSAVHARAAPGVFQGLDVTVITLDFGRRK
jgi:uncharacterized protein YkwD